LLRHDAAVDVLPRGDMQPFVQLGLRLLQDGHRVRLASHACFRDYVLGKGLEFYPLAADPLKLSEFMVKTQGFVIPTTPELIMQVLLRCLFSFCRRGRRYNTGQQFRSQCL
jgi:sterol 3beta-glucosyltransferase